MASTDGRTSMGLSHPRRRYGGRVDCGSEREDHDRRCGECEFISEFILEPKAYLFFVEGCCYKFRP